MKFQTFGTTVYASETPYKTTFVLKFIQTKMDNEKVRMVKICQGKLSYFRGRLSCAKFSKLDPLLPLLLQIF